MAHEEPLGGMPRNYLRACILLQLREESTHGYELVVGMSELGVERVDPGGLYRVLRAMEQEGLLTSWWEQSNAGPPRRAYTLTEAGDGWLLAWARNLQEVQQFLGVYLERFDVVRDSPLLSNLE